MRRSTTKRQASNVRTSAKVRLDALRDLGDFTKVARQSSTSGIRPQSQEARNLLPSSNESERPAGIEYVGLPGFSKECQDAILRLLQYGNHITHVRILSSSNDHCLLLTVEVGDVVAVA
jgi:hypothetical protein